MLFNLFFFFFLSTTDTIPNQLNVFRISYVRKEQLYLLDENETQSMSIKITLFNLFGVFQNLQEYKKKNLKMFFFLTTKGYITELGVSHMKYVRLRLPKPRFKYIP